MTADQSHVPARSMLYGLPMAGPSGGSQEGLLEYAQRLSVRHSIKVRDMFAQLILPTAGIKGAFYVPGHFSLHSIRGCNGWSSNASYLLAAVEKLTGRSDLRKGCMVGWASILHPGSYAATKRRWCGKCLNDGFIEGAAVYRILWSFEPVKVCLVHREWLAEVCDYCGVQQPILGDALAVGHCSRCHHPLWKTVPRPVRGDLWGELEFNARSVTELVQIGGESTDLSHFSFATLVKKSAREYFNGSVERLEREMNFTCRSLSCRKPPKLSRFLQFLYRTNLSPREVLRGDVHAVVAGRAKEIFRSVFYRTKVERDEIAEQLERIVHRALNEASYVTTTKSVCREAGISERYFSRRFPQLARRLRVHAEATRPLICASRLLSERALIGNVIRAMAGRAEPLTEASIARALRPLRLSLRRPQTRRFVKAELDSLNNLEVGVNSDCR